MRLGHWEDGRAYLEESIIEVKHVCAHEIFGADSTENHDVTPNSLITENTNTTVSVKTSKSLGDLEQKD